jgi:hypothetical protein
MMSEITNIDYFLPITRAHLSGSVTTVADTVRGENGQPIRTRLAADHTFALVTVADKRSPRTLKLEGGFWQDYSLELELTEDGRLASAGTTSAGRAGTVLATGVTVAAVGAALAVGHLPLAAALASTLPHTAGGSEQPLSGGEAQAAAETDPAWEAYRRQQPELATRTSRLLRQQAATVNDLDKARDELLGAVKDPANRDECRQRVLALQTLLAELDADLAQLRELFASWRETTLVRTVDVFDELLPLDTLPRFSNGALDFGNGEQQQKARSFWEAVGCVLATIGEPNEPAEPADIPPADAILRFLRPRWIALAHVTEINGNNVVTKFDRALVMDNGCERLGLRLREARAGKRRTSVRLSPLGALTGVSYGGTSSAAAGSAGLSSVAELPHEFEHGPDEVATRRRIRRR